MILPDFEIRRLCKQNKMIAPFAEEQLNPASYDVRLSDEIMIESLGPKPFVRVSIKNCTPNDPYILKPGQFCLGSTQEIFNMPRDIAAEFALKSSRGREGYSHALSAYIDPGFHNSRLTLELHNITQLQQLPLYPGLLIGQIVFTLMLSSAEVDYSKKGHYNDNLTVMPSVWQ